LWLFDVGVIHPDSATVALVDLDLMQMGGSAGVAAAYFSASRRDMCATCHSVGQLHQLHINPTRHSCITG
jgi:hypothetical protein